MPTEKTGQNPDLRPTAERWWRGKLDQAAPLARLHAALEQALREWCGVSSE